MLEMAQGQDIVREEELEVEAVELSKNRGDAGREPSPGSGRHSKSDARAKNTLLAS